MTASKDSTESLENVKKESILVTENESGTYKKIILVSLVFMMGCLIVLIILYFLKNYREQKKGPIVEPESYSIDLAQNSKTDDEWMEFEVFLDGPLAQVINFDVAEPQKIYKRVIQGNLGNQQALFIEGHDFFFSYKPYNENHGGYQNESGIDYELIDPIVEDKIILQKYNPEGIDYDSYNKFNYIPSKYLSYKHAFRLGEYYGGKKLCKELKNDISYPFPLDCEDEDIMIPITEAVSFFNADEVYSIGIINCFYNDSKGKNSCLDIFRSLEFAKREGEDANLVIGDEKVIH
jgi:hypothetical protein